MNWKDAGVKVKMLELLWYDTREITVPTVVFVDLYTDLCWEEYRTVRVLTELENFYDCNTKEQLSDTATLLLQRLILLFMTVGFQWLMTWHMTDPATPSIDTINATDQWKPELSQFRIA